MEMPSTLLILFIPQANCAREKEEEHRVEWGRYGCGGTSLASVSSKAGSGPMHSLPRECVIETRGV